MTSVNDLNTIYYAICALKNARDKVNDTVRGTADPNCDWVKHVDEVIRDAEKAYERLSQKRGPAMTDAEKVLIYEQALEEIAYGAPWGGPDRDHIRWMRNQADKALTKCGAECAS
jgi:hypothetical protein